jgi:hypothetical protein
LVQASARTNPDAAVSSAEKDVGIGHVRKVLLAPERAGFAILPTPHSRPQGADPKDTGLNFEQRTYKVASATRFDATGFDGRRCQPQQSVGKAPNPELSVAVTTEGFYQWLPGAVTSFHWHELFVS